MDKEKRKKLWWIIAIFVLILVLLLWILKTSDEKPLDNNTNSIDNQPVFIPPSVDIEYQTPEKVEETSVEFSAINLAKTYAARLGSWSTDNQGHNINELFPLSTSKMIESLKNIELNFDRQAFRGTTTKSISAEIVASSDSRAEVVVNTQKIETNASLEKTTSYQKVRVKMVKSNDKWLVDEFIWE